MVFYWLCIGFGKKTDISTNLISDDLVEIHQTEHSRKLRTKFLPYQPISKKLIELLNITVNFLISIQAGLCEGYDYYYHLLN